MKNKFVSYHYIQVNADGVVVCDSWLSGEVVADNMIPVDGDFDPTHKKYDFGSKTWVEYIPEVVEQPPTQVDNIEAQVTYIAMMLG